MPLPLLLHNTGCPGPPEAPTLSSGDLPDATLSWSPPSASGAWRYTYEVTWTNGSIIVPRQAGTTGQIPGLQAETQYTVEITAYSDSTLCPAQSTTFTFMTTQSKLKCVMFACRTLTMLLYITTIMQLCIESSIHCDKYFP